MGEAVTEFTLEAFQASIDIMKRVAARFEDMTCLVAAKSLSEESAPVDQNKSVVAPGIFAEQNPLKP